MATTTEIEPGSTPGPQLLTGEPPKRRPGRPPNSKTRNGRNAQPAGEEEEDHPPADALRLATAPRSKGEKDLWLDLANYKPADWDRTIAYLYRVAPTIDRRSGGRPINIRKYAGPFDKDRIMLDEGSGVYRIDILRVDEVTGEYRRLVKEYFDILNMDYPPRVPPGDWIDDPANEVWKWAGPKLVAQQQQQNGGTMYPPGFNIKEMYDSAFQLAKAMAPPAKDDSALITLLTTLATNRPEPTKQDDTATKALLGFLEKQNDRLAAELSELRKVQTAPPPPQPTILQQMKDLKPVVSEFAEMFAQQTGNTPWWQGPLEKFMESVPDVIDLIKVGQQNGQRANQPAPQWNAPPSGIPAPAAPPPQGPPPNQTAAAAPEQPNLTDEQKVVQELQALYQKWAGFIMFIAPQMLEHFKTETGAAFRDWFLQMHGLLKWADLRRELGPELLSGMIAQHPGLSQEMSPPQLRDQFFQEFFEEVTDEEDEEAGDGVIDIRGGE